MTYDHSLSINLPNRPLFLRFAKELRHSVEGLTKDELVAILLRALKEAGYWTARTKIEALTNLGDRTVRLIKRYKRHGVGRAFREDMQMARAWITELPYKVRNGIVYFTSLPKERRIECIISWALALFFFYVAAGGTDFEGGLPDADLFFGIGQHRNVFSHTILMGLGVETVVRFVTIFLAHAYCRLPDEHLPFWDELHRLIQGNRDLAIGALWAGIGAHLLKDASLFSEFTKPYVGLPWRHSITTHQAFFAANSIVAEVFAVHSISSSRKK